MSSQPGFAADPELLVLRAGTFGGLAERTERIAGTLSATLDLHGCCWGGDAAGQAFASTHVEPAGAVLAGIGLIAGGLRELGAGLTAAAATYAESEQASEDAVGSAGRELA